MTTRAVRLIGGPLDGREIEVGEHEDVVKLDGGRIAHRYEFIEAGRFRFTGSVITAEERA